MVCDSSTMSSVDLERQVHLRLREAVDVAVQQRVRVGGHRHVEAGRPKAADDGVVVPQVRGSGIRSRLHQADRPSMARQDFAERDRPLAHRRLPVGVRSRARRSRRRRDRRCRRPCRPCSPRGGRAPSGRPRAPGRACAWSASRARPHRRRPWRRAGPCPWLRRTRRSAGDLACVAIGSSMSRQRTT